MMNSQQSHADIMIVLDHAIMSQSSTSTYACHSRKSIGKLSV